MSEQVRLYYKNCTSQIVGQEHGISDTQLKKIAEESQLAIKQINKQRKAGKTAYRELPYNNQMVAQVKELASELRENCDNLVVLGIGGSALGNIALQTALNPYMYNIDDSARNGPRLFVFDNVDPCQFGTFLDWIEKRLDGTIFNCISKSGQTAETMSQFMIVRHILLKKFGSDGLKKHIVATTDRKEGILRRIADEEGLRSLDVPQGVGGRFSVLSAVGLFSAAMCGIDIEQIMAGARNMDDRVASEDFYKNPAAVIAGINHHFYTRGKKISVMMPYSFALRDMADWYRQLWAESLGKEKDLSGRLINVGPTPVRALGATDQHSQVQLYREGPNDKLFTFLEVEKFSRTLKIADASAGCEDISYLSGKDMGELMNNEKTATEYALVQSRRPCLTVLFPQVSSYTVGQFIYMYEVVTAITGALFGINTYDQPAVELGKEATSALMGKKGCEKPAEQIKQFKEMDKNYLI